jgi:DNA-binding XRE family transcriptional regulator
MTATEHHDLIETLKNLAESWKASIRKYREAMASNSLEQAREAESERRKLLSELRVVVSRLRAEHPEDAGLRAAWDGLSQIRGFLLLGIAETITPYLEKLIGRSSAEWQPLARGAIDGINPRTVHKDWVSGGWPQRLLRARQSLNLTQKEAAHTCQVGEQTFERWERGEQPPALRNIVKVLAFIQSAEEKVGSRLTGHLSIAATL